MLFLRIEENKKWYKIVDFTIYTAAVICSTLVVFYLIYNQATHTGDMYLSDIHPYIDEMLGTQDEYSFPYPVMFKFAWLIYVISGKPELSMAIAVTMLNTLAIIVTRKVIVKQTNTNILATVGTLMLFFCSMLYSHAVFRFGIKNFYLGVYSPNPWHNQTLMAARPFMILAFVYGVKTLCSYEEDFKEGLFSVYAKRNIKDYFIFGLFMLLVTMTKPAYTLPHGVAFAAVMLYRLLSTRFRNIKQTIFMGLFYIPTIVALLYQYSGVFTGTSVQGDENGIGIAFARVWSQYNGNIPLGIVLAAAFPIVVLLLNFRVLKESTQYRMAWFVYLVGLLMALVFYEKGFREIHFNFQWGYMCGLFIVFLVSVIELIKQFMTILQRKADRLLKIKVSIEVVVLVLHVLCGLNYFVRMCWGISYC